ncbi:uncharacterized protein isoform X2 [Musca autumnalis]|uniref:uncharacterized protein isoform X1 n=1 Tax=Musca autumnalis TaxID=221902 RepID=UPI003CF41BF4
MNIFIFLIILVAVSRYRAVETCTYRRVARHQQQISNGVMSQRQNQATYVISNHLPRPIYVRVQEQGQEHNAYKITNGLHFRTNKYQYQNSVHQQNGNFPPNRYGASTNQNKHAYGGVSGDNRHGIPYYGQTTFAPISDQRMNFHYRPQYPNAVVTPNDHTQSTANSEVHNSKYNPHYDFHGTVRNHNRNYDRTLNQDVGSINTGQIPQQTISNFPSFGITNPSVQPYFRNEMQKPNQHNPSPNSNPNFTLNQNQNHDRTLNQDVGSINTELRPQQTIGNLPSFGVTEAPVQQFYRHEIQEPNQHNPSPNSNPNFTFNQNQNYDRTLNQDVGSINTELRPQQTIDNLPSFGVTEVPVQQFYRHEIQEPNQHNPSPNSNPNFTLNQNLNHDRTLNQDVGSINTERRPQKTIGNLPSFGITESPLQQEPNQHNMVSYSDPNFTFNHQYNNVHTTTPNYNTPSIENTDVPNLQESNQYDLSSNISRHENPESNTRSIDNDDNMRGCTENKIIVPTFCSENSGIYPHPVDCSMYIVCRSGLSFECHCASRTDFNAQMCDHESYVKCMQKMNKEYSRDINANESHAHELNLYNISCPSDTAGVYPHPFSNGHYIKCFDGQMFIKSCRRGLKFNLFRNMCDVMDYHHSFGTAIPISLWPKASQTESDIKTENITFVECIPSWSGKFLYPFSNRHYVSCQNGTMKIESCMASAKYSIQQSKCLDVIDENDFVRGVPKPLKEISNGTSLGVTCGPQQNVTRYAHPTNWRKYLKCHNGKLTVGVCLKNKIFDIETKKCIINVQTPQDEQ